LNSHLLASAVVVLKAHDVVLAQITARLHLDDFEGTGAQVGKAMDFAERDVGWDEFKLFFARADELRVFFS
jgi:hypothetical protein